jgi:hypothetical protein
MIEKLIKWNQLSKLLSGSDNSIRENKIPKKYEDDIKKLFEFLEAWENWRNNK